MKTSSILLSTLLPFASSAIADTAPNNTTTFPVSNVTNQTLVLPQLSPGFFYEHEVVSHLASRLQACVAQVPSGHGLLFQIEDRSEEYASPKEKEDRSLLKRGVAKSIHKGWKGMPFDQRLGVIGSVTSTIAVPLYLLGAGVGFNEYEISNFKEKLLSKDKSNHANQSTVLSPPPPFTPPSMRMGHRKRSWTDTVQDYLPLIKRTATVEKKQKVPKQRNAKVDSVLGMVGVANSILYLGTATVSGLRVMAVRDSDTSTYKRSILPEMKGFTVTCIPVGKLNEGSFRISKEGLLNTQGDSTKQLTYVDADEVRSNEGEMNQAPSGILVETPNLSNGHDRVLVKRAVIPLHKEESTDEHTLSEGKSLLPSTSNSVEGASSHTAHPSHQEAMETPLVRRQNKGPRGGKPHGEGHGHPNSHGEGHSGGHGEGHSGGGHEHPEGHEGDTYDADGPVHIEKIKHVYHVNPNAPNPNTIQGQEHLHSAAPATKKSSNMKKALAFAAGGAGFGYLGHMYYQSSQQQQQAALAAAQAQAQAYGDGESLYYDPQAAPAAKRDVGDLPFSKRSPGGGRHGEPAIVFTKHVFHHHNVHPDYVPSGAYHLQEHHEGGQGESFSRQGGPAPTPHRGTGSGPESKIVYVNGDGKGPSNEHEYGSKSHDGEAAQKKKMSIMSKIALVGGGGIAGAYLHAAFSPAPSPQPGIQPGYYDDGTGAIAAYRKRDLSTSMKKRSQIPMSIHHGQSSEAGSVMLTPDYLDYYHHFVKRDLIKRKHDSYDDYLQALKRIADKEEEEAANNTGKAGLAPTKIPLTMATSAVTIPSKRDKIEYNSDGNTVHFTSSSQEDEHNSNSAIADHDDEEGSASLQKRNSNITFDTDEKDGVHFKAEDISAKSNIKSTVSKAATASDHDPTLDDEDFKRRSNTVDVTYETEADGAQYFHAGVQDKKTGATVKVGEESDATLQRRNDLQNITFDHSKNGSHFAATLKNNDTKEDEEDGLDKEDGPDLKELKAVLQRRDHNDHHHDIDYHKSKDNEVVFHASTPYTSSATSSNASDAADKAEKGITIHIVPRSDDDSIKMVRRNRIVADR